MTEARSPVSQPMIAAKRPNLNLCPTGEVPLAINSWHSSFSFVGLRPRTRQRWYQTVYAADCGLDNEAWSAYGTSTTESGPV